MLKRHQLTIAAAALGFAGSAFADVTTDTVRDVTIADASAAPDGDGGVRLMFRLVNDSYGPVVVTGVSSPNARSGSLTYVSHHGPKTPLVELLLLPDEEADFATSHLVASLSGVAPDADPIRFTIRLRDGEISGEAHVH